MLNKALVIHQDLQFKTQQSVVNMEQFVAQVALFQTQISQSRATGQVLLYHPDPYQFALRLFALSLSGYNVVLPPNGQPDTLKALQKTTPFYCGDIEAFAGVNPATNIELSQGDNTASSIGVSWPTEGALIFYTSGSTGQAKPIVKPWQVINRELSVLSHSFLIKGQVTFLATVSHQHIYGLLFRLLWPMQLGQSIECKQLHYPEHIAQAMAQQQHTVLVSSPAQLARLCEDNVITPYAKHLQWLFSSGGPLANNHAETLYQQLNRAVTQVFGSTETGGIAYRQVVSANQESYWQPFQGSRVYCDSDSRLYLDSYLLKEQRRALDDKGEVLKNGQFKLLGRVDRTVKIEEKRLNLDELESHLLSHSWIKEVKVILLPGKRVQIGAVVVLNEQGERELEQSSKLAVNNALKSFLSLSFERICLPRKWRYITALPYNSQAKLSPKALEQYFVSTE